VIDQAFEVCKLVLIRRDLLDSGPEGKVLVRERRRSGKSWASNWIDQPKPLEPVPDRGHVEAEEPVDRHGGVAPPRSPTGPAAGTAPNFG
jgi:hypothetical protein